ncbi:MAG: hydrogenase iron-sulfur subunit [Candidatus Aquicultorales bacterium]
MRTSLFISTSHGLIGDVIDVRALLGDSPCEGAVVDSFFAEEAITTIVEHIDKHRPDGVILAGESLSAFEKRFNGMLLLQKLEEKGVNPNKIACVNLKEQVALPHRSSPSDAYGKAKLLIEVAEAKIALSEEISVVEVPPRKAVAIMGATAGGLLAASRLLAKGYAVTLIDEGQGVELKPEWRARLEPTLTTVSMHPKAQLLLGWKTVDLSGYAGDYTLEIESTDGRRSLAVGGIIIAMEQHPDIVQGLHEILRIEVTEDWRFAGLNEDTLRTVTKDEGIALIPIDGTLSNLVSTADSAVLNLTSQLNRKAIYHKVYISEIDEEVCGGCGTCVKTCLSHASRIDPKRRVSYIDERKCRGCGNCVVACPTGGRDLISCPSAYLSEAVERLSRFSTNGDPKILMMTCEGCGEAALNFAGESGLEYSASILPLNIKCGGRVDTQHILLAFEKGFDGVSIGFCEEGRCLNTVGSADLERRANLFREILRSRNINPERLRLINASPCEDVRSMESVINLFDELKGGRLGE